MQAFTVMMVHELAANAGKGDRPGWLQMDPETAMAEIWWHSAKLAVAVKEKHEADAALLAVLEEGTEPPEQAARRAGEADRKVVEHAADVANMAMMLLDVERLL